MPRPISDPPPARSSPSFHDREDAATHDDTDAHVETLRQLDLRHDELKRLESALERYLRELRGEERVLRLAFDQSSTSLREQRERERNRREDEAVRRLEEVLMGSAGGSSSDGSEDDDENVGDSYDGIVGDGLENLVDDWDDEKMATV